MLSSYMIIKDASCQQIYEVDSKLARHARLDNIWRALSSRALANLTLKCTCCRKCLVSEVREKIRFFKLVSNS